MARRVTELYNLGTTQSGVDFVDVNVDGDVPVYIDPAAIRGQTGVWVEEAIRSLQTYFQALLRAIKKDDQKRIRALIAPLVEPNETHLGQSRGASRGHGLGSESKAEELIQSLRNSKAAKSGFLKDLDDAALLVDGIDRDIVSDIATCVIRKQLIEYTQVQARFHGIKMESQESGPIWNSDTLEWTQGQVDLPRAANDKLLLVPKSIVRVSLSADKGKYYRGYLRPYFESRELDKPTSHLVEILRDKSRRVRKTELDKELGTNKTAIVENTEQFPKAIKDFKAEQADNLKPPIEDQRLKDVAGTETESLSELLEEVRAINPGKPGANSYHHAVAKLLTALFDTQLGNEILEAKTHGDLKRVDIRYDNVSTEGFFRWLGQHFHAAMVPIECKNYGSDVANPEFDQLVMRLSEDRGQFGLLICRGLKDPQRALRREMAAATDKHGFVVCLTDDDLARLVADAETAERNGSGRYDYPLLRERFNRLINAN